MTRLPIRVRLTLGFAVAMAVVLGAIGTLVYLRVGGALLHSVDQTLGVQGREAASHAHDEHGLVDPDAGEGATVAQLIGPGGAVLRSSPAGLPSLLAHRSFAPDGTPHTVTLQRPTGEWRLVVVRDRRGAGVVVVGRSLAAREETLHRLLRELLVAGPIALLLASLAGYGLAAGALRPVEAMRRRAEAITADSKATLPVPPSSDEVSRLAVTLNEMLERLHASIEHERRFVADASHELRTPLGLLRTELELALRRPRPAAELELALRSALEETERLSRLADDLLLLARAEQGSLPIRPRRLAAAELLDRVALRFGRRAAALGRTVRAEPTDLGLEGDPDRLEQALGNLVENALGHGGGDVVLSAVAENGCIELHVQDSGRGFPPTFLARAFGRFSRADEARSRGGAGLGLSIVDLIATAHRGTAAATNRPGGGADVFVSLPRDPARS